MSRPIITGTHTVPKEISALKPKEFPCDIKVMVTTSKITGCTHKHYYVYDSVRVGSGKIIGKIEGGKFVPNSRGKELFDKIYAGKASDEQGKVEDQSQHVETSNMTEDEIEVLQKTAVNLNIDISQIALQLKDYGEYAMVLACTESVLKGLEKHFSDKDARLIYALSIIYFIQEYTPASYVKDVFDTSILSNKWPTLAISEKVVGSFLKSLGQHPAICDKYSQSLIEESSGLTAIDGHVILTCSKQNDLADYGNKYSKIGNKQLNVLQAYDAIKEVPLTSKSYEGSVPDKTSVQDLLASFHFPSNTIFLVDMGFYSEEDFELYRKNGKHFVIPVPDNTNISKAMQDSIVFTGQFTYTKRDENGVTYNDIIQYRESTVAELENIYEIMLKESVKKKNKEAKESCKPGEKPKKYYSQKINRSEYGDDRIIMFRDEEMHKKMVLEYQSQIGSDEIHTEENLALLAPKFGLIIMRTNLPKDTAPASVVYGNYKKRWKIETHYNFIENVIKFCGLQMSDYCSMQGLSFLMITVGQVKAAFVNKMKSSKLPYVQNMSLKECLIKGGRFKLVQNQDKIWRVSVSSKKKIEMLKEMGVNISEDLSKLNDA